MDKKDRITHIIFKVGCYLIFTFCVCIMYMMYRENHPKDKAFTKQFIKYTSSNKLSTDNGIIEIQNSEFKIWSLKKSKTKNNSIDVVLTLSLDSKSNSFEDAAKEWTNMSRIQKRNVLKECANYASDFLSKKIKKHNYNIYIVISSNYSTGNYIGNYVYELNNDTLWTPNCENTLIHSENSNDSKISYKEKGYEVFILDGKLTELNKEHSSKCSMFGK